MAGKRLHCALRTACSVPSLADSSGVWETRLVLIEGAGPISLAALREC